MSLNDLNVKFTAWLQDKPKWLQALLLALVASHFMRDDNA